MDLETIQNLLSEKKIADVKNILQELNEFDIASFIEELPDDELIKVFRLLPKNMSAEVFVNLEDSVQKHLINMLSNKEATQIIEDMYTDDAADLLDEMPAVVVRSLLKNVDEDTKNDIYRLLKYPDNSAGTLMATEYIHLKKGLTIKESIARIRNQKDDFVSYDACFVTDNKRTLLGRISCKDLLISDPKTKIDDVMEECEHVINTLMDQEEVAEVFRDYNYSTLPVVDLENRLVGIITVDDIMDIMVEETTEDIEKMAAILPSEKPYNMTSVIETVKSRIPWLLLLMISATFTGKIIENFEEELKAYTILTAFIPMLMDTGGNAGSQSSVSIIRALSLKDIEFKDIFKVMWKEARVAIICSIILGIANFIKLIVIDRTTVVVALTVCLTLILTILIAKLIGALLPLVASKLGFDPAVMASPFITTIVDACSLLIYFYTASILLGL